MIYSLSDYVVSTSEVIRIILTTDLSIFAVPMAELSRIHVMCLVWQAIRAKNLRPIVRMILTTSGIDSKYSLDEKVSNVL